MKNQPGTMKNWSQKKMDRFKRSRERFYNALSHVNMRAADSDESCQNCAGMKEKSILSFNKLKCGLIDRCVPGNKDICDKYAPSKPGAKFPERPLD